MLKKVIAMTMTVLLLLVPVSGMTVLADEPPFRMSISVNEGDHEHDELPLRQELYRWIEEYTNTEIEWWWFGWGHADQLALMFASGDLPTVLMVNNPHSDAAFAMAVQAGAFWDLTDYLDQFPNLAHMHPVARQNVSINGRIYAIPRARAIGRNSFGLREDWLMNLGLNMPTTIDELYDVLWAFTYLDPDGNGLDDTYGLGMTGHLGAWDIMQIWFGAPNGWGIMDGQLMPAHMFPEYDDALRWFRRLYADGIVNPEFHEFDAGQWDTLLRGPAGATADVVDRHRRNHEHLLNEMGIADTWTMIPYIDAGHGPRSLPTLGFNHGLAVSKAGAPTEADLLRALAFIDAMADPVATPVIDWGLEGVDWEFNEDGHIYIYTNDERIAMGNETNNHHRLGINQLQHGWRSPETTALTPTTTPPDSAVRRLEASIQPYIAEYAIPNLAAGFTSPTMLEVGSELNTLIADMRRDFILGVIDETAMHEIKQQWLRMGGQDVIDEINELWSASRPDVCPTCGR